MEFLKANKKWLLPLLIGLAAAADLALGGPGADQLQELVFNLFQ